MSYISVFMHLQCSRTHRGHWLKTMSCGNLGKTLKIKKEPLNLTVSKVSCLFPHTIPPKIAFVFSHSNQ